jgi:hypothetical protein
LAAACAAVLRPSGEGAGPSRIAVMRSASSGNSILTTERRAWRMPSGWRSVSSSSIASPRPKRESPEGRSLASAGVRRPSGSGSARRRGVERGRGGRGAPSAALITAAVRSSANTRIRGFVISMNWVMHAAPRRLDQASDRCSTAASPGRSLARNLRVFARVAVKNPKERRNPSLLLSAVLHAYSRIGGSISLPGFSCEGAPVQLIADDLGQGVEHSTIARLTSPPQVSRSTAAPCVRAIPSKSRKSTMRNCRRA